MQQARLKAPMHRQKTVVSIVVAAAIATTFNTGIVIT